MVPYWFIYESKAQRYWTIQHNIWLRVPGFLTADGLSFFVLWEQLEKPVIKKLIIITLAQAHKLVQHRGNWGTGRSDKLMNTEGWSSIKYNLSSRIILFSLYSRQHSITYDIWRKIKGTQPFKMLKSQEHLYSTRLDFWCIFDQKYRKTNIFTIWK